MEDGGEEGEDDGVVGVGVAYSLGWQKEWQSMCESITEVSYITRLKAVGSLGS